MVFHVDEVIRRAEADQQNSPGYCLQQVREWAGIPARFPTAAIAWNYAERKQTSRTPRRGAFMFWTGGSKGYGHIALHLGNGLIRSTDAGGSGRVATRTLEWFETNWPSQNYVGWTDNVNGITVPGVMGDGFDMAEISDLRQVVREELRNEEFIKKVGDEVWRREFSATNANGASVRKSAREYLTTTWETVKKHTKG